MRGSKARKARAATGFVPGSVQHDKRIVKTRYVRFDEEKKDVVEITRREFLSLQTKREKAEKAGETFDVRFGTENSITRFADSPRQQYQMMKKAMSGRMNHLWSTKKTKLTGTRNQIKSLKSASRDRQLRMAEMNAADNGGGRGL